MKASVIFVALVLGLGSSASAADEPNSIVIVFKDGHQQTISMADVARIEFRGSGSGSSSSSFGRGRFLGKWRVGNGAGGNFFITLEASGEASKTLGASHGTWTVLNGEARIAWDDGWHDAIRKVGDKYEKVAYSPGTTFDDKPANVADAVNTSPQPN
jgi:hypothetical protein